LTHAPVETHVSRAQPASRIGSLAFYGKKIPKSIPYLVGLGDLFRGF